MSDRRVDYLLIGGGLASGNCARWLRESGAEGSILLAGRELDLPYDRPPCSKGYLRGKESREDTLFRPADWYEGHGIEALTRTSVTKLDTAARTATLSTKDVVTFDKALVATGAGVRRLNVPGCDLEGIHYLRTLGNSDSIRDDAAGKRVVMIGGSYIASEVAASLTELGSSCSMVMIEPVPLSRGFGMEAGRFLHDRLAEHGITVCGDDELDRFEGADGRVTRVITKRGHELEADAVVIGVGAAPDVMLARSAGLELGETEESASTHGCRHRCPGSSPPATSPNTKASFTAAARSGSSTGTWPSVRAGRWRSTCSATTSPTTLCPISSRTSPTGCRSSTSAPPSTGTRRSFAARSTTGSSSSGT